MILKLRIEHAKDATGIKKRVIWSTLLTEIEGMKSVTSVAELDKGSILGDKIEEMINFIVKQNNKEMFEDYILSLQISKIKTKTPYVERGMASKLVLKDCIIEDFFELNKFSTLDKEFVKLSTNLLAAKTADLKIKINKNEKRNVLPKNG